MRRIGLLAVILAILALDQSTKMLVRATLRHRAPRHYGLLTLVYAENAGAFLSFGESLPREARRVIFDGLVAIGLAVAAWFLFSGRMHGRDDMALALIIAGGVGNLIDRLRFSGLVTDFIYLAAGRLHTGVFNVADLTITVGVLWLAFGSVLRKRTA